MLRKLLISGVALSVMGSAAFAQTARTTGLLFADRSVYLSIPPAPPPIQGGLPATVDLSQYGYFPEPGNQGNQESCVGWAVAYGLKSYQKNREFRLQNLEANFRFSPAYVYNQIKQNNCSGGSYITQALEILEAQGALTWDNFAYTQAECDKLPSDGQIQSAWEYRIARWMRVNVQSLTEMKAQIARGFPLVIGMKVHQAFMDWRGAGVYNKPVADAGPFKGGHALLLVGYADQLKAFKVFNSWGTDWGDGGYAWIDYRTFQALAVEGYVTVDIFMQHFTPVPITVASAPTNNDGVVTRGVNPGGARAMGGRAVRGGQLNKADNLLTTAILSQAVRSTTKPNILFKWQGADVVPFSVWLDLNTQTSATVQRVEYWFDHPSFTNPKKSEAGSTIFLASWKGYGCIPNARVKAFLKNGNVIEAPFDLCAAQKKF